MVEKWAVAKAAQLVAKMAELWAVWMVAQRAETSVAWKDVHWVVYWAVLKVELWG